MEISLGCSIEIDLFIHTYITFLYVPNSRNFFELINFHIGGLLLSSNSSRHTASHIQTITLSNGGLIFAKYKLQYLVLNFDLIC